MVDSIGTSNVIQNKGVNNNKKANMGYAYTDKYGFSHVVKDYETAVDNTGNGKVYEFKGRYAGGYAIDKDNNRAGLKLPGAVAYGNDVERGHTPKESKGVFALIQKSGYSKHASINKTATKKKEDNDQEAIQGDSVLELKEAFEAYGATDQYLASIKTKQLDAFLDEQTEKA